MEDASTTIKTVTAFPYAIVKEEALPIVYDKEASQSLKKDKGAWIPKKNENGLANHGYEKKISLQKMPSPRSPNIMTKNPITQRENVNSSPKK